MQQLKSLLLCSTGFITTTLHYNDMLASEMTLLLCKMADHNDESALKRLFDEYYPRLLLFANSFLRNQPVAEELVEDVFIKLWQNKATGSSISSLPAYLFRATKNNILNYQKSIKNQDYLDINDTIIELKACEKNPEEICIASEALQEVNAAIQLLPPKCRLVFQLVKEDGLKYRETAELLNISVKTVENQMSLALKKISEALLKERTELHPSHRFK